MATIMLGAEFADARAVPALERLLDSGDEKLRRHAKCALARYAELGIVGRRST